MLFVLVGGVQNSVCCWFGMCAVSVREKEQKREEPPQQKVGKGTKRGEKMVV